MWKDDDELLDYGKETRKSIMESVVEGAIEGAIEGGNLGEEIGSIFGGKFEKKAQLAGGIILLLLGIKILCEHLGVL